MLSLCLQGALYCLLGNHSGVCLANLHDWECIALTWPAIVRSGLSSAMSLEKPSIVRLFDDLADKIHRQYETIGIDFSVRKKYWECAYAPISAYFKNSRSSLTDQMARNCMLASSQWVIQTKVSSSFGLNTYPSFLYCLVPERGHRGCWSLSQLIGRRQATTWTHRGLNIWS